MTDQLATHIRYVSAGEAGLIGKGWPPALAKATVDDFTYAVGLKTTGLVIVFEKASDLENGFVRLDGVECSVAPGDFENPFRFERGIEVRLSEIAWALDAPFGS